ncbi:MAG: peptidase [Verrucomicrobiales bacterium]|nr:peptidase [Verrucomicrobiales bacterium]
MKLRLLVACICCLAGPLAFANESADLKEVLDLLRANLAGAKDEEINRAAVQGLISQLAPRVSLVGQNGTNVIISATNNLAGKVYDLNYGYLRITRLDAGSDKPVLETCRNLLSTNKIKGLVLDLRYSTGEDYAAAVALADAFIPAEKPLMDFGEGMKKSNLKSDAITLPLVMLVNGGTSGSVEAFAGALHNAGGGLLIGSKTAGMASIAHEFPLKSGQRLRIATTPIILGDGQAFPNGGLKPDIQVDVTPDDEKIYFSDAYKAMNKTNQLVTLSPVAGKSGSTTNRVPRHRMNEAELVRMQRDGQNPDLETATGVRELETARPIIHDPALARAIDLLKGLAVVQRTRST